MKEKSAAGGQGKAGQQLVVVRGAHIPGPLPRRWRQRGGKGGGGREAVSGSLIRRGGERQSPAAESANTHAQQGRSLSQPRHRLSPSCAMNPLSSRLRPLLLEGRDRIRQMEEREVRGAMATEEREGWYRSGRSLVCQWPKRGGGAGSVCAQQSRARSLLLRLWRACARYSSRSLGVVSVRTRSGLGFQPRSA